MKKFFALAVLALGVSSAMAQVSVGLTAGQSRLNVDLEGFTSGDKTDTAVKGYVAYDFGNSWSVEAQFLNLGKATARGGLFANDVLTAKSTSFGVGAAYHFSFNDAFGAVARLGVAKNELKIQYNPNAPGFFSESLKESTTQPYFGLGLTYKLTDSVRLGLDIDSTKVEFQGEKANVRAITFGAAYRF